MAKVKYDVSKVEKRTFETPKPGVYEAAIYDITHGPSKSGNDMFTITFEITKGDYKGSRIWYYILTDGSQEWRLREFTDALGLKPKGSLDTDELKGMVVQIRTDIDPPKEGYDEKARIKNVLPAKGTSAGSDDGEEEAPYEEWELAELKEEVEARELTVKGKATKAKLIAALEADDAEDDDEDEDEDEDDEGTASASEDEEDEEDEDEEEDDEEEDDEDTVTRADLAKMDRNELKALIKEQELEVKITKSKTEDKLREEIATALELPEEEDEDEDDEKDTDYEEWDVADLKAELKERGLKADGRKATLVARLKKDDASEDEPF